MASHANLALKFRVQVAPRRRCWRGYYFWFRQEK